MTKESGAEVEEDIYEASNLGCLLSGQKASIPEGQGIRLNGVKYMQAQVLKNQTYQAKIVDESGNEAKYPVTIEEVHVMKKGKDGIMLGVKGGYFFIAKHDSSDPKQTGPAAAEALAIGFYWAVGPDA